MRKKRLLDLVLTTIGAIVWVPVVTGAGLLILLTNGRPIFYRSNRRIATDTTLRVVKFRTMVRNADKLVNRDTVAVEGGSRFLNIAPDSPLYHRAGRLIERFALTELPQFVHVLSGRMSIVGNRPLPDNVMDCLTEEFPYAIDRFQTRAGITGPAQLVGRADLSDAERLTLEAAYCRACTRGYTMRLDLAILFATIFGVLHIGKDRGYDDVLRMMDRYTKKSRALVIEVPPAEALEPITRSAAVD